jgi:hypothetical protein
MRCGRCGCFASRTYKIIRAAPMGLSYARDIAERYGIGFAQLQQRIAKKDPDVSFAKGS